MYPTYLLFEMTSSKGVESFDLPKELQQLFGKMGHRTVTVEEAQQPKKAEKGSWTGTLFKGAVLAGALFGVAYIGYRYGFFDGANGVFDEVKKHAYEQMGATPPSGSATFTTTSSSSIFSGLGSNSPKKVFEKAAQSVVDSSRWGSGIFNTSLFEAKFENIRQEFTERAYESNSWMNVQTLNMTAASETVSDWAGQAWDAASTPISKAYYTTRNEALTLLGSATLATLSILFSLTKCIRATRGF